MKKFNNIFEQINVELPAVWKIQTLRTEIRLSPCKAAELQPQIDAARLTIICARRGYLYTARTPAGHLSRAAPQSDPAPSPRRGYHETR